MKFQSLDWVERLSDLAAQAGTETGDQAFQSLDWVERLSDWVRPPTICASASSFNPSTGLSVFQTKASELRNPAPVVSIPRLG